MSLLETIESCCYNSSSILSYEPCIWTRETCLNNLSKNNLSEKFPHGLSQHGELILIGKTRSKLSSSNRITDQIGQAKKSVHKLDICHLNKVYQLDSFALLNFPNSNCFKWSNFESKLPDNALRVGYDTVNESVLYVGRTVGKNVNLIGKLSTHDFKLITSVKQEIKILDSKFQVLCLKPSPQSLKILCRNQLRSIFNLNNLDLIKLKNKIENSKLRDFVKLKCCLKPGEYLNRNQGIQSINGKYRLILDNFGRLKFYFNEKNDFIYLYEKVECLWFCDLKLVICFEDQRSTNFLASFWTISVTYEKDSQLKLCNKGLLNLISSNEEKKIVIQFRHDLSSYINSTVPKYDFSYFYTKNEQFNEESSSDESVKSDESDESYELTDNDTSGSYSTSDSSSDSSEN
ncbi:hypothetical protein BpHYR1_037079 [Brachionus plicatilis]|uniref:Uncharacterized protein n=1 Tax=Brachionus plicatilis TaxID=10195 RepID=A0A3M7SBI3_BRAPC|nr:hypothetical protein BpHYR1_037079 [Brachionus plicatilis]